jgi:uncharacterized protein YcbK (DUF882 family)
VRSTVLLLPTHDSRRGRRPIALAAVAAAWTLCGSGARAQTTADAGTAAADVGRPDAAGAPQSVKRSHYAENVRKWHELPPHTPIERDAQGRPKLVLYGINTRERLSVESQADSGGFAEADLDRVSELFRDPKSAKSIPISPALLDVVYRIQRHFSAPEIRFVSAYRSPKGAHASHHAKGEALDLIVPGASDVAVAVYARTLGTCGVGLYPNSGFVHVDVRASAYSWVDRSGPGQPKSRRRPRANRAKAAPAQAKAKSPVPAAEKPSAVHPPEEQGR